MTVLAELLACEEKALGYITYVFECLDEDVRKETRTNSNTSYFPK